MSVWQTSRSCHLWFGLPVNFPLTPYLTTYIGVEGMKSLLASFFFFLTWWWCQVEKSWSWLFSPLSNSQAPWTLLLLFSHQVMSDSFVTPMDCSPLGSSVHGISQAKILEWVALSSFYGSSWSRGQTCISWIGSQILYHWATGEPTKCSKSCRLISACVEFYIFDAPSSFSSHHSDVPCELVVSSQETRQDKTAGFLWMDILSLILISVPISTNWPFLNTYTVLCAWFTLT